MLKTLTIEELKEICRKNKERLQDLHPDTRRAQVIQHNWEQAWDELDRRIREKRMTQSRANPRTT